MAEDYRARQRARGRAARRARSSPAPSRAPPTCATSRSGANSASSSTGPAANTISSLLSCLAAHAAVLRSDGVARRPLAESAPACFPIDVVADHELVRGFAPHYRDAALALERPRRGEAGRQGLSHAGALVAKAASTCSSARRAACWFSSRAIRNTTPTRWRASIAATCCASCAAKRRRRRTRPPTTTRPKPPPRWRISPRRAMAAPEAAIAAGFPVAALSLDDEPWRAAGVQLVHNWLGLVARRKTARSAATFAVARWGG